MKIITTNKKANFEYFVLKKYVAGLSLQGSEVKSIRAGQVNINDSFVLFRDGQATVHNMFVKNYGSAGNFKPDEKRARVLLLNKSEIVSLASRVAEKGLTVVPLNVFIDRNLVKMEIGLCKGKLLHDKRDTIKRRDNERELKREVKASKY